MSKLMDKFTCTQQFKYTVGQMFEKNDKANDFRNINRHNLNGHIVVFFCKTNC